MTLEVVTGPVAATVAPVFAAPAPAGSGVVGGRAILIVLAVAAALLVGAFLLARRRIRCDAPARRSAAALLVVGAEPREGGCRVAANLCLRRVTMLLLLSRVTALPRRSTATYMVRDAVTACASRP